MKIILNILTHGDERIGLKVAREIVKLGVDPDVLVVQIANEKAAQLRKRFVEKDLNRSFPGKMRGKYEERLAYKLLPIIKSADVVIDIHSTTTDLKNAIIVTKVNQQTIRLVKAIGPQFLIYMKPSGDTALISGAKVGLAFEYGNDHDPKVVQRIVQGVKRLLVALGIGHIRISLNKLPVRYLEVTGQVGKPAGYKLMSDVKNYKLIPKGKAFAMNKKGDELVAKKDFSPVLFGNNSYKDIFGFEATKSKVL